MKNIDEPNLNYRNILIKCVESIRDTELQDNVYKNIKGFISRAENYKELAGEGRLFEIDANLKNNFTYKDMIFLYGKLRDSPHSRVYYDYLLATSIDCPYCGVQLSASLDHYLPKKHYPMYSIDPINLIPCCSDCNSLKSEHKQIEGEETFHPYFDKLSKKQLLYARALKVENNIAFSFYLQKPDDLTDGEFIKIRNHFEILELPSLYSILASKEIHTQIYELKKLYQLGGKTEVAKCLEENYFTNLHAGINSWKTSLYEGLRNDDWFCGSGIEMFEYISDTSDKSLLEEVDLPIPIQND